MYSYTSRSYEANLNQACEVHAVYSSAHETAQVCIVWAVDDKRIHCLLFLHVRKYNIGTVYLRVVMVTS